MFVDNKDKFNQNYIQGLSAAKLLHLRIGLPRCNTGGGARGGWEAGECGTRAPDEGM